MCSAVQRWTVQFTYHYIAPPAAGAIINVSQLIDISPININNTFLSSLSLEMEENIIH